MKTLILNIRATEESDTASLIALFTESVHKIASASYTPEQLKAWAPASPDLAQWQTRLASLNTLVAEKEAAMAGFISFTDDGHIDLLFTSPMFARQGVASKLFEAAEKQLQANGVRRLTTDASLEARPFFESRGFLVVEEQAAERNGIVLRRFAMVKGPDDNRGRSEPV